MGGAVGKCLACCIPRPSDPDYRSVAANDDDELLELQSEVQDNSVLDRAAPSRAGGSETSISYLRNPELLDSIRSALAGLTGAAGSISSNENTISVNDCCLAMKQALDLMEKNDESIAVVLDELLKNERKRLTKAGKMAKVNFAANMISMALEEQQQDELYEIFAGLPPSVLGDSDGMSLIF
jgi:hypothetical protein